jgi:hypothetical protein
LNLTKKQILQEDYSGIIMNYKFIYDHLPLYVLAQTEGRATVREFDAMLRQLVNAPEWKTGYNQIIDHRKLDISLLTPFDMRDVTNTILKYREKIGNGRCAFIVSDPRVYGYTRMYEMMGGKNLPIEMEIFYTMEEAVHWIREGIENTPSH